MFNSCKLLTPLLISWLKTYNASINEIFNDCIYKQQLLQTLNNNNKQTNQSPSSDNSLIIESINSINSSINELKNELNESMTSSINSLKNELKNEFWKPQQKFTEAETINHIRELYTTVFNNSEYDQLASLHYANIKEYVNQFIKTFQDIYGWECIEPVVLKSLVCRYAIKSSQREKHVIYDRRTHHYTLE